MAETRPKRILYNFILGLALLSMLVLSALGGGSVTALALEQEARCAQAEHIHTEDCYLGEVLLCSQKAHIHTQDCYLLLLQDNDINWLLQTMNAMESKSLEGVINSALVQALSLNEDTREQKTFRLAAENLSRLNQVISENHIEPAVTLNADLGEETVLKYEPPPPEVLPEPMLPATVPTAATVPATIQPPAPTQIPTVPDEPPVTTRPTEVTEPAETTVPTEPTETTVPTESTETTVPTEPTETTVPTEPTETSVPTEPPETTEVTEPPTPPETTQPPEPSEPDVPPGPEGETEPSLSPDYGQAGIWLLVDGSWTCVDVVDMDANQEDWGTNYTFQSQTIRDRLAMAAVVSPEALGTDLTQTPAAPPEGVEELSNVIHNTIYAGRDGSARHFLLASDELQYNEETQRMKRVFTPVEYHTVTLVAESGQADTLYVQSGESLPQALTAEAGWEDTNGVAVTGGTAVTEAITLYTQNTVKAGAAETRALNAVPNTSNYGINFYIRLDGSNVLVGSDALTYSRNGREYTGYQKTVDPYTANTVTDLTTGRLNRTYSFRYNANGSTTYFGSTPAYSNNRVYFNNTSNAQYALLTDTEGTPIDFYTFTLDMTAVGGGTREQYVESGLKPTLEPDFESYLWYDENGDRVETLPSAITETTTLYARYRELRASFQAPDGAELFPAVTGSAGADTLEVSLPSLAGTDYAGYLWIVKDGDGTAYPSDGSASLTISEDTVFTAIPGSYTVTFLHSGKEPVTETVDYRQSIPFPALPEGWTWVDEQGNSCLPGTQTEAITQNMTYTATERIITVSYDVSFPTGQNVKSTPTIYGTASATAQDTVIGGNGTTTRNVSSRTAERVVNSTTDECAVYYFRGWRAAGSETVIEPGTTLTWQELNAWADVDGNVELEGVWTDGTASGGIADEQSVGFYIRYDSVAVDAGGNVSGQDSNLYTKSILNTYVGGLTDEQLKWTKAQLNRKPEDGGFSLTDDTADNSYTVDQKIRALYGEKASGVWLYDFPRDEDVFAFLRNDPKVSNLKIGDEVVPIDQLSTEYYAVRWYVFKKEDNSWHIDGKLVPREGHITITKRFNGDADAVAYAKEDFTIVAQNGTKNADGGFTPYTGSKARTETLTLPNRTDDTFQWKITGVHLGEYWQVTEYTDAMPGYSYYAEYTVYDTDGELHAVAEDGTQLSVVGKAFAVDVDPDQGMLVDFSNYYYKENSILIKKEDARTGRPIGGAAFQLYQGGNLLTFDHNPATGTYDRNPAGTGAYSQIVTESDGFSIITTTNFSYEYGDVTVREAIAPPGYDPAPDITLGDNGSGTIVLKRVGDLDAGLWDRYAEVPNNDVLVVKNNVSEQISVSVEKVWSNAEPASSVKMVLQANGQNAAAVFPGFTNAQVELNEANGWQYTWQDLPRVADGAAVTWSVKEVEVGGMPTLADGISFANWTVTYVPGAGTDRDGDGDIDNWHFTVTNSVRRPQLILTKVSETGALMKGAVFTLEQVRLVSGSWQRVSGSVVNSQTTNAYGMLTFDNLIAGAYYRLTETAAPVGYAPLAEPVVLTVNGVGEVRQVHTDGTLTEVDVPHILVPRDYNLQVENLPLVDMPETGGPGTQWYTGCGLCLMAAALYIALIKRRRECGDTS